MRSLFSSFLYPCTRLSKKRSTLVASNMQMKTWSLFTHSLWLSFFYAMMIVQLHWYSNRINSYTFFFLILYFFYLLLVYIALWSQRINKKHMRKFTENYFNFTHESSRFAVVIQYVYEIVAAEERAIPILFFCIIFWRTLNSFHKKILKKTSHGTVKCFRDRARKWFNSD